MQLTKHTDYAFRVLIYLGSMKEELTTIQKVSDVFDISKPNLMKVVNELTKQRWIEAIRGKNGGIHLGVSPHEINLRDVVTHMEKILDPVNCNKPLCHIKGVCELKPILMQAQNEYLNYLSNYTLADLVNKKTTIRFLKLSTIK